MIKYFLKDGKLTIISEVILLLLVLFGFFGIPVLNISIWIAIPIGVISVLSAGLLIFEGAATSIGLKPFTNDPLGWRKAKKSYQSDAMVDEEKNTSDKP